VDHNIIWTNTGLSTIEELSLYDSSSSCCQISCL